MLEWLDFIKYLLDLLDIFLVFKHYYLELDTSLYFEDKIIVLMS